MILSREQINRYLRHIIIPEIRGQGQKKIIEAKVFVIAGDVKESASLLYYLAASGVGNISCCFLDHKDWEKLFDNIRDLNTECVIQLIDIKALKQEDSRFSNEGFALSVFLLGKNKIGDFLINYPAIKHIYRSTPVIFGFYDGWKGFIQYFRDMYNFENTYQYIKELSDIGQNEKYKIEGSTFSKGFLGAVEAIEVIKHILGIGLICEKPLCFDLLSMKFSKDSLGINDIFQDKGLCCENYAEESISGYYNISKNIKDCRVLIVGTGGLGSPAALSLAGVGVGTIGLMDYDSVELSNLNRQILHSSSRIGLPKVDSADRFIKSEYSDVKIIKYNIELNKDNVFNIISEYDVIIDGVDNFPARYLLNDACYFKGKPMIEAGAVRFGGLNMTILPGTGSCYRCLFPDIPQGGSIPSCTEAGVLGPVPGVMGYIQGAETVKLLLGIGDLLYNKIMYFDALDMEFDVIKVGRAKKCRLCGESPSIKELMEYDYKCGRY